MRSCYTLCTMSNTINILISLLISSALFFSRAPATSTAQGVDLAGHNSAQIKLLQASTSLSVDAAPQPKVEQAPTRARCPIEEPELCDPELRLPPPMLPDLMTLTPHDLRVVLNNVTGERLLRFSNSVMNLGWGPVELWGTLKDADALTVEVIQKIFRADGSAYTFPVGSYVFHEVHGHWHWDNFSKYELWTVGPDGGLDELIEVSGKVGYCLRDNTLLPGNMYDLAGGAQEFFTRSQFYMDCGWERQGISPGWVDTYLHNIDGQHVDITGLADGDYALLSMVDPGERLKEYREDNNAAVVYFRLLGNTVDISASVFDQLSIN